MALGTVRARGAMAVALAAAALAACASKTVCAPTGSIATVPRALDWRSIVTISDHDKLRQLRTAFLDGIAQARAHGFGAQLDSQGRLFNPDYAEDGVALKPGAYRCRAFSLGARIADHPAFVAEPAHGCTITADGPIQHLAEQDGPQRLEGRLFPDEPARGVFLGTRVLPDEATALLYGRDPDRDMVGALQRVGDARWRIAVPRPAWGPVIDIIEIVPAA